MSIDLKRFMPSRRGFLKSAGIAAAASVLTQPLRAAAAPDAKTYELENGFIRLSGAYGKLAQLACDPTGRGNYAKTAFSSMFLGATDFFTAEYNDGVAWTSGTDKLALTGIQLPSSADMKQEQLNAPIQLLTGHTLGQSFTSTTFRMTRVGGQFPTWSSSSSSLTLTVYAGTPVTGLTEIASAVVNPLSDNGWAYVDVPAQPAGTYYLEASDGSGTPGWWAFGGDPTVDVGGASFADRQQLTGRSMTLDVVGFNVEGTASWTFSLDGPKLTTAYEMQWQGSPRADIGLTLNTSWVKDGYSVAYDDGILFSRFYTDQGAYLPAQQLKRRAAWTSPLQAASWIAATGTGPYDLQITGQKPTVNGTMLADAMVLTLNTGDDGAAQTISRTIALDVRPHADAMPDIFPVFIASDQVRASQVSSFYWERALSFRFDGHAAAWADWNGRVLDWTATAGRDAQAANILAIKQNDDGYVWSWTDAPGWPFPDPKLYDARHFSSNAMYILGAWRYYSWSGDSSFLTTMLPRLRKAMDFYLESLGGNTGIVTIASPDHSGRDGALSSNYWDITSFGHLDAFLNAYFYGSLEAMAQLEDHVLNPQRAKQLRELRTLVQKRYNELFWNDKDGRYVQCVDVDGVVHDYGATYVNLEASSFGLPSGDQADRIFAWLDHGHTELQDSIVLVESGGLAPKIAPGHTMGVSFTAAQPFTSVAARFPTYNERGAAFTMTLYAGLPGGAQVTVAEQQFSDWGDGRVAHIDLPEQVAGVYYLEVSNVTGTLAWWSSMSTVSGVAAYSDGAVASDAKNRFVAALGDHYDGPADIYSTWKFAPRVTTRRNSYWFFLSELSTPFGQQVQDGGAILYTSGFDVMARARYQSADDAWARMTAILDRWKEPDHISGGTPLFHGESTADVGGSVGTDVPFPESGLAPASFVYAFVGVEAEPDALVFTPNLPSALSHVGVRNLQWHGQRLELVATRTTITIKGDGVTVVRPYQAGRSVRVRSEVLSRGR